MDREKEDITKKMQYILNMRAVLNKNALFSDGTKYYRNPTEPEPGEKVKISFGRKKIMWIPYIWYPAIKDTK